MAIKNGPGRVIGRWEDSANGPREILSHTDPYLPLMTLVKSASKQLGSSSQPGKILFSRPGEQVPLSICILQIKVQH